MNPRLSLLLPVLLGCGIVKAAGPFPPGPDSPGTDAVAPGSITAWASAVTGFTAGPMQTGSGSAPASYGSTASALGAADAAGATYAPDSPVPVVSLGEGGSITLRLSRPVIDGEGADFAVFENGFTTSGGKLFAELAFVEVSSDGVNFTRFPAVSCTSTATQLANFGSIDPAAVHNLAGKHPAGYGTPFDLAELGLASATHVRVVDVIGDVKNGRGSTDSQGNLINDPWPTNYQTSGFDLDAVGVIHAGPDAYAQWLDAHFSGTQRTDPQWTSPDADPDADGKSNLMEFAAGFDPAQHEAESPLSIAQATGGGIVLHYRRNAAGDAQVILQRLTSTGWQPAGGTVTESGAPIVSVQVSLPVSAATALFRLKVVR